MNYQEPSFYKAIPIVLYAVPFFIGSILLELLLSRWYPKVQYETKDTTTSLLMGLGNLVLKLFTGGILLSISLWVYQHRLFNIPIVWWSLLLAFLFEDLSYYWYHRLGHTTRWFWAAHVNHHSSQHYNLSTALRQTWLQFLSVSWLFWIPMAFLGFHPYVTGFFSGISLVYQYWIHTELIDKMGPFEVLFNTPSHHRVHHGTNLKYLDKNYAGVLIIWDKLFGTFEEEDPNEPAVYGIIKGLGTFNPLKVAFHEWIAMVKDAYHRKDLRTLWKPPGWSPDGSTLTVEEMRKKQAQKNP